MLYEYPKGHTWILLTKKFMVAIQINKSEYHNSNLYYFYEIDRERKVPNHNLLAMKKILLLSFYLSLVCCNGCKDNLQTNSNSLPPITENGANTIGALVNGKIWVPAGSVGGTANFQYNFDNAYAFGTLNVLSYRRNDTIANSTTSWIFIG